MVHLKRDEAAPKMGHPVAVVGWMMWLGSILRRKTGILRLRLRKTMGAKDNGEKPDRSGIRKARQTGLSYA
jgi:hypothetical protein